MARIRFYVATSLDGFIADGEGSVDWMAPYDAHLYGYDNFLNEIGAIIMGRRTYQLIHAVGEEWPYQGKPVFVLSSQALGKTPVGVSESMHGMWEALQQARQATHKDIWIAGGAVTMQSALDDGFIDLMEIFLVPVLLGSGLSLLNDLHEHQNLVFDGIESFPDGVVKLRYVVPKHGRPRAH
jgi:dihydrofolate reductase